MTAPPDALASLLPRTAVQPRPYQLRIVRDAVAHLAGRHVDAAGGASPAARSVLIESPTGSGKTVMGLLVAKLLQEEFGVRVGWAAMRRNLLAQTAAENAAKAIGVDPLVTVSMFDRTPPGRAGPAGRGRGPARRRRQHGPPAQRRAAAVDPGADGHAVPHRPGETLLRPRAAGRGHSSTHRGRPPQPLRPFFDPELFPPGRRRDLPAEPGPVGQEHRLLPHPGGVPGVERPPDRRRGRLRDRDRREATGRPSWPGSGPARRRCW